MGVFQDFQPAVSIGAAGDRTQNVSNSRSTRFSPNLWCRRIYHPSSLVGCGDRSGDLAFQLYDQGQEELVQEIVGSGHAGRCMTSSLVF